jgi:hypothetical protein
LALACNRRLDFAAWRGLGLLRFIGYENTGALINKTDNGWPETARRRRRWGIFFVAWTVFVLLTVWWLLRRAEIPDAGPGWFVEGDTAANASLAERIANWFKLADLNFHRAYPWILLAPYVAWLLAPQPPGPFGGLRPVCDRVSCPGRIRRLAAPGLRHGYNGNH